MEIKKKYKYFDTLMKCYVAYYNAVVSIVIIMHTAICELSVNMLIDFKRKFIPQIINKNCIPYSNRFPLNYAFSLVKLVFYAVSHAIYWVQMKTNRANP